MKRLVVDENRIEWRDIPDYTGINSIIPVSTGLSRSQPHHTGIIRIIQV
jgi:hypothetical protein